MKCPKCGKDLVEIDAGYGIAQTYVLACKNKNCELSKRGIKIPVICEIAEELQSALERVKGITEKKLREVLDEYIFDTEKAEAIKQLIQDKIDGR